jgi:Ankyrin repeats (3 copies)
MAPVLLVSILLPVTAPGQGPDAADPFRDALVASVHHFAEGGKLAHVQAILEKYPKLLDARRAQELGKPSHGDGHTPLQTAARHGHDEVVALLIRRGANLNAADGSGYTPLHLAAEGGHLDVVKRLVKAGAKVDAKTTAIPGGFVPGPPAGEPARKHNPIPACTALQIAEDHKHAAVAAFLRPVQ